MCVGRAACPWQESWERAGLVWAGKGVGGSAAPEPRPSTSPVSAGPTRELAEAAKQEGERGGKLESPFPPRARPLGRMWLVRGTGQREPAVVRADAINDSWGCLYTAHGPPDPADGDDMPAWLQS